MSTPDERPLDPATVAESRPAPRFGEYAPTPDPQSTGAPATPDAPPPPAAPYPAAPPCPATAPYPPAGAPYPDAATPHPPAGQQYPGQQYPQAAAQYPPAGHQHPPAGHQHPSAAPAGAQYPPPPPAYAAQPPYGSYSSSYPATASNGEDRPLRVADMVISIVLLGLGVLGVATSILLVGGFSTLRTMPINVQQVVHEVSVTPAAWFGTAAVVHGIGQVILLLAAVGLSILNIRKRRLSFWVPLVGAALSVILFLAAFVPMVAEIMRQINAQGYTLGN